MPVTRSQRGYQGAAPPLQDGDTPYGRRERRHHNDEPAAMRLRKQEQGLEARQDTSEPPSPTIPTIPHALPRMPVKRRVTFSPRSGAEVKRFRTASARQSGQDEKEMERATLPPHTPLRSVLASRIQRLLRDSPNTEELFDGGHTDRLNDMLVMDDAAYEQDSAIADMFSRGSMSTPDTPLRQDRALRSATRQWESERKQLEQAVVALTEQSNTMSADMKTLQAELDGLLGSHQLSDLRRLRQALCDLRIVLADELPDGEVNTYAVELLHVCIAALQQPDTQEATHDTPNDTQSKLISQLYAQIDGLLNRLALSTSSSRRSEEQRTELVQRLHNKAAELSQLNDNLARSTQSRLQLEVQLSERSAQLLSIEVEGDETRRSLQRAKQALHNYRLEEDRLQKLIIRMEADHARTTQELTAERKKTAQGFAPLGSGSIDASQLSQASLSIEDLNRRNQALFDDLEGMSKQLAGEHDRRDQLELALEQRTSELKRLESDLLEAQQAVSGADLQSQSVHAAQSLLHDQRPHVQEVAVLRSELHTQVSKHRTLQEVCRARMHTNQRLEADLQDAETYLREALCERDALRNRNEHTNGKDRAKLAGLNIELQSLKQQYDQDMLEASTRQHDLEASIIDLRAIIGEHTQRLVQVLSEKSSLVQRYELELSNQEAVIARLKTERSVGGLSNLKDQEWFHLIEESKGHVDRLHERNQEQQGAIEVLTKRDNLLSSCIEALLQSIDDGLKTVSTSDSSLETIIDEQRAHFKQVRCVISASLARGTQLMSEQLQIEQS